MRVRVYLLAIAISLGFAACAPFGTSKAERVARLETDLNESRQFAYQNFDPAIADYLTLATQNPNSTWDAWFPPAEWPETTKYVLDVQDVSQDSLTARVTGPEDFQGPQTLTVGLVRIGMDWYINRLELSGPDGLIVQ